MITFYCTVLIKRHHSRLNGKPSSGRKHVLAFDFILTVKCSTLKGNFVNESDTCTKKLKHEVAVKLKTERNLYPVYLQQKALRKTPSQKTRLSLTNILSECTIEFSRLHINTTKSTAVWYS